MNALQIVESNELSEPYQKMVGIIKSNSTEIERASMNFMKHQSQFMDNMLTVSHLTPIRNLRQILAEIEQIKQALQENYYKVEKKKIRILRYQKELKVCSDAITCIELEVKIEELEFQIANTMRYVEGAIRKYTNYILQYNAIMEAHGIKDFTEYDFEVEEERYHIAKAFQQGLSAARAHGGFIDEGNQIYFEQIGINGTVAQREMTAYLTMEEQMLSQGAEPTHEMQVAFILRMADKFKGNARKYAEWKGQKGVPLQVAMNL